ncbi:50S ribosomal protein L30 [Laceyella sacchari]|jgi:large subunit ribosomal protein L30|uniref:Large ribosomal subunit protein uL30 n=2 Tax=Laceyella sacchari TaxID=37482 RepID=A0ABY5U2J3_LACSH|nr:MULTISPECIES: 50S ribosomal protein L30 [Laceyella]AUS07648.1 50S ribosomal protein L30 [Laceyella sacchari]MRG28592.1 50S ribosomal protein L30 [Laceyella tengchongensis]UWE03876.1 50S ribosomal protein L30 [Laceyella sacchari]
MTVAKKLAVTLKRSMIGRPEVQRVTLRTLGLTKREQTVVHADNPAIRGMIKKVNHLVEVKEIAE